MKRNRSLCLGMMTIILTVFAIAAPSLSSELPPGTQVKGTQMNGYLSITSYIEIVNCEPVEKIMMVIVATCNKGVPFQLGPFIEDASEWPPIDQLLPEFFSLTYFPNAAPQCYDDPLTVGLAITNVKNFINTGDSIGSSITLQPVVPQ